MQHDFQYYEPRSPRHAAICSAAKITLQRHAAATPRIRVVKLVDFSKHGMQIQTSTPLREGEVITVSLEGADDGKSFQFDAKVRWRRQIDAKNWSAGCEFPFEADWEMLGELFLQGILSQRQATQPAP